MLAPTLYWIQAAAPLRLAIASRPRGDEELIEEMTALAGIGIGAIVSLLEPLEACELGLRSEQSVCETLGISFTSLPIPDRGVPGQTQQFVACVRAVHAQLVGGIAVAVHCRAGIGRSGLLTSSLLVASGHTAADAIRQTSASRRIKIPDTPQQEAWLHANTHLLQCAA